MDYFYTIKKNLALPKDMSITELMRRLSLISIDETSVVDKHRCHMAAKLGVFVDEVHSKLPTLYWLP